MVPPKSVGAIIDKTSAEIIRQVIKNGCLIFSVMFPSFALTNEPKKQTGH